MIPKYQIGKDRIGTWAAHIISESQVILGGIPLHAAEPALGRVTYRWGIMATLKNEHN